MHSIEKWCRIYRDCGLGIVRLKPGQKQPRDKGWARREATPMNEKQWLSCSNPYQMLSFLSKKGTERKHRLFGIACCRSIARFLTEAATSDRKLRLFAVTCCRRVWRLLNNIEREAVILMERFLEGLAGEPERAAAFEAVKQRTPDVYGSEDCPVAQDLLDRDARFAAEVVLLLLPVDRHLGDSEKKTWCDIFRDVFGPLSFRPLSVEPSLLQWNDRAVVKLAQAAYDDRDPERGKLDNIRLAVLADALEEAGCSDEIMLRHLRGSGPHVRGCWVIDLLLNKA
jgi:hypothetical protein